MFLITFAIVKVLPDPVTPNKVCAGTPSSTPSVSWAIASGWSPVGWYSEINSKFINSMFSLMRCKNTVISLDIIYSSLKNRLLSTF